MGVYWLEVTDANNCKGRDSIDVYSKDCMAGFFAPNAFSPNGDGKNDIFRPMLFGNVKLYELTVFNRWGEIVFKTDELMKGWNGTQVGKPQDSNVFVWVCRYQFEEEGIRTEKGTVVLVR